jgi:hypothetical protein
VIKVSSPIAARVSCREESSRTLAGQAKNKEDVDLAHETSSPEVLWELGLIVQLPVHQLCRSCARLCHSAGGELENRFSFSLVTRGANDRTVHRMQAEPQRSGH